jgi:hypothetical protein
MKAFPGILTLGALVLLSSLASAQVYNYDTYQVGTHTVTVNVHTVTGNPNATAVIYSEGFNSSAWVQGGAPVMNGNVVGTNTAPDAEIPGTNGGTAGGKNTKVKIKKGGLWYETASGAWLPARPAVREAPKTSKHSSWGFRGGLRPGDDTETMPGS